MLKATIRETLQTEMVYSGANNMPSKRQWWLVHRKAGLGLEDRHGAVTC
jgi:hypothetical protein